MALKNILWIVTYLILASSSVAAPQWIQVSEENGIEVSRREFQGEGLYEFRGIGDVKSSIPKILALLVDVKRMPEWVDGCTESQLLERFFPKHSEDLAGSYQVEYGVQSVPWPLTDRDYILKSTLSFQLGNGKIQDQVFLKSVTVPHKAKPVVEDLVRITKMTTEIRLTRVSDHVTEMEFRALVDPAGWIPDWIVNLVSRDVPYKTLEKVRAIMKDGQLDQELEAMLTKGYEQIKKSH